MNKPFRSFFGFIIYGCIVLFCFFLIYKKEQGILTIPGFLAQYSFPFEKNILYVGHVLLHKRLLTGTDISMLVGGGHGIFVDRKGYIITNKHVVDTPLISYIISFNHFTFPIRHIWFHDTLDLALVQLSGTQEQFDQIPLPYFFDSIVYTGQICLGSTLSGTLFTGKILSIGPLYRINVPVLHGSSGSPLWNSSGYVIGLITATTYESSFIVPLSSLFVHQRIERLNPS